MFDPMNSIPSGMGNAAPYGVANRTSAAANALGTAPMGGTDQAEGFTSYRPQAGRADRLMANIVGPQMSSLGGGVI